MNASSLPLCADFDAKSRMSDIPGLMDRVESRAGVVPVAYLENSTHPTEVSLHFSHCWHGMRQGVAAPALHACEAGSVPVA